MKPNNLTVSFAVVKSVNSDDTVKVIFQYPSTAVTADPQATLDCPALVTSANDGSYAAGQVVAVLTNNANSVLLILGVVQGANTEVPL